MLQYISIYIIYVNFSVASLLKCLLALSEVAISIPYLVCVLLFNYLVWWRRRINKSNEKTVPRDRGALAVFVADLMCLLWCAAGKEEEEARMSHLKFEHPRHSSLSFLPRKCASRQWGKGTHASITLPSPIFFFTVFVCVSLSMM